MTNLNGHAVIAELSPTTVQCTRCRVTVPVAALADPNRCNDKDCPLKPIAQKRDAA